METNVKSIRYKAGGRGGDERIGEIADVCYNYSLQLLILDEIPPVYGQTFHICWPHNKRSN